MSRPITTRKIGVPPRMMGYRPYGMEKCKKGSVNLKIEEFESLRLIDYQRLSQEKAASFMNISRPTFTRIYNNALKVIATALVEGRCIEIDGGNFNTEKEWFRCRICKKVVEGSIQNRCSNCNSCFEKDHVKIGF